MRQCHFVPRELLRRQNVTLQQRGRLMWAQMGQVVIAVSFFIKIIIQPKTLHLEVATIKIEGVHTFNTI